MLLELLTTIEGLDRFMEKGGSMIWPMKMGGLKDKGKKKLIYGSMYNAYILFK